MTSAPLLDVRELRTEFHTRQGRHAAVRDVSFTLDRGQVLGLVGESGSGKSVTGFSILGLVEPPGQITGGQVLFKGQNLVGMAPKQTRQLRGHRIAMIFQDPMMTLNPVLRIGTQITETIHAHVRVTRREAERRAADALAAMGIADPGARLRLYPHQLSGGMRQRVAIAIALLFKPELVIADEPTTALDVTIQAQILSEVQRLIHEHDMALIWISHDLSVIAGLADQVAVMYGGRIVEHGSVDQVIDSAAHPYTQGLLGSLPANNTPGHYLQQISGMAPSLAHMPSGCAFAPRCARATASCQQLPQAYPVGEQSTSHWVRCFHPGSLSNERRS